MRNRRRMPEYYARTYEHWYRWFSRAFDFSVKSICFLFSGFGGERKFRESVVNWVDPQPGERVLDICSGTGTLAILMAERLAGDGEVMGIEISSHQLKVAQNKVRPDGLAFIEGDARSMPFPDTSFEKAVISGALHEMPREVRRNVLLEAHRVIKPQGRIVVVEQNEPAKRWKGLLLDFLEWLTPEFGTYKDMLRSGLANEITRAGFRITKTDIGCWELFQFVMAERVGILKSTAGNRARS